MVGWLDWKEKIGKIGLLIKYLTNKWIKRKSQSNLNKRYAKWTIRNNNQLGRRKNRRKK